MTATIIDILQERGFLESMTSGLLPALVGNPDRPLRVYCGFDPSADSLHLGNLVATMALAWFQRCGHTPVAVVGGATGMIGDPSGRSTERPFLDEATLQKNQLGIRRNLEQVLGHNAGPNRALFLNNYDWYKEMTVLAFLRDVGCHFRLGTMLSKESVKGRLQSAEGMSFTEFSYQILQGYDFWHLFQNFRVTLQIGGSDQWGNITAGIDLVRKMAGAEVYGLTLPLLTRSDGQKFGKSEKGAIWLAAEKLSPYEFYQHLFRFPDADVIVLLKLLTFLDMQEIRALEKEMQEPNYLPNKAQKILAKEVTELIHGQEGLAKALKATQVVLPGKITTPQAEEIMQMLLEVPSCQCRTIDIENKKVIDILVQVKFMSSKGDVRRLIRNKGLWLNNSLVENEEMHLMRAQLLAGRFLLFSFGKRNKAIIEVIDACQ
jgi:tyrosyl-tRNA synthetase